MYYRFPNGLLIAVIFFLFLYTIDMVFRWIGSKTSREELRMKDQNAAEEKLKKLGIVLPPAPSPVANYVPSLLQSKILYISGQIARAANGHILTGTVGQDLTVEEGQAAARLCALNILAQAKSALGSLDRISQVLRITGYVNALAGFADHPKVMNGASDLLVEILSDKGRHTRAAIGVSGLPGHSAVEIDAIIAII